jgi:8-oxo-dGTP pyrophosphatase MutT (NUDIX family)
MDRSKHYCNNCGNIGHLYRECRHPILSYGVILYDDSIKDDVKIIMIERKDSISYIEFLRGKYKSYTNIEYIKLLMSRFSIEEKQRLLENDFDTLWKQLWIHTETINPRVKREYTISKRNFQQIQSGFTYQGKLYSLESLIKEIPDKYHTNEWELPKGRRNKNETNRECAVREFQEETNIYPDKYNLITNIVPLVEGYTGINDVRYKHVYYIGRIHESCQLQINMENKDQYTEVKNISWLNKKQCNHHIRDYDDHKKKVVNEFFDFIDLLNSVVTTK